jgi:hypothetical protein
MMSRRGMKNARALLALRVRVGRILAILCVAVATLVPAPAASAAQDYGMLVTPSPAGAPAPPKRASIETFNSFATFSKAAHPRQTISFDEFDPNTPLGNPAQFGSITIRNSNAANLQTEGVEFIPSSPPNALAPFAADGTLAFGDTTLTLASPSKTNAAGLYLIIGGGSNQEATWTNTVTVQTQNHSLQVPVSFVGQVGEQQFIGFRSNEAISSISFTTASREGASTVVALDDVLISRV